MLIWPTVYVLSVPKIYSTQIQETNIYYVLFQAQCTKQSWHICRTMSVSNKSNKIKKGRINLIISLRPGSFPETVSIYHGWCFLRPQSSLDFRLSVDSLSSLPIRLISFILFM